MPPARTTPVRIAPKQPLLLGVRPGSPVPTPWYETASYGRPILPCAGKISTFSLRNSNFCQIDSEGIEQLQASTGSSPRQYIRLVGNQVYHGAEAPAASHRSFLDTSRIPYVPRMPLNRYKLTTKSRGRHSLRYIARFSFLD